MPIYRGDGGSGDATTDAYASQVALNAQRAEDQADIATTKASEASNSATAAATSASAAGSSATNAATSETNAAASASAASTSETNAASSESAAATSAGVASLNATSAASSASSAATSASNASTSETNAATSESNAATSETNAASSASSASTSATNAATSATNASNAQTAAEAAQTAAEAAQQAIDGFFLGAQASNPTVDLNGNAVTAGDWYFNTGDNTTRIYDGSTWNTINPDLIGDATPQLGGTLDANGNNIDMGVNVITDSKVGQWDTAYGWGDHSTAGYLTAESDTLDSVTGRGATTTNGITVGSATVTGDLTVDTNTLYVDSTNNRVGIGTTSTSGVQGLLHIHSSSDDNGDGDGRVNFGDESTVIISTNATSAGSQGYYGSLFFGGQDVSSETQQVWKLAGISAYSSADIGTTGSADLLFYTTNSASTPSERMRIDSSGNVGIGTGGSVSAPLHVGRAASGTYSIFDDGTNGRFTFGAVTGATNENRIFSTTTGFAAYEDINIVADNFLFSTGGPTNVKMKISSSGNVGIGVTNPSGIGGGADLAVNKSGGARFVLNNNSRQWAIRGDSGSDDLRITARASSDTVDADYLTITSGGNVGIGTDSPSTKIDAFNSGTTSTVIRARNDTTTVYLDANNGYSYLNTFTNHPMLFGTNNAERMRIDGSGNVGIGTNLPNRLLTLGGSADQYISRSVEDGSIILTGGAGVTSGNVAGGFVARGGTSSYNQGGVEIYANGAERARIDSSGLLHVKTGNIRQESTGDDNGFEAVAGSTHIFSLTREVNSVKLTSFDSIQFKTGSTTGIDSGTEAMRIDSSGNLLVGKSSTSLSTNGAVIEPDGRSLLTSTNELTLVLNRLNAGTPNIVQFYVNTSNAGYIKSSAGGTPSFGSASDIRLKENVTDHESELANVMALRPVRWDWKDNELGSGEGFVAQELEQTAWSDLVSDNDEGYKQVNGLGVVETRLIKAIQEQQAMIETLQAQVAELQGAN